jgi:hypothetical protein
LLNSYIRLTWPLNNASQTVTSSIRAFFLGIGVLPAGCPVSFEQPFVARENDIEGKA